MRIEFAANASFLVTLSDGRKILTDPWYIDGIYYGSWANFPPLNSDVRQYFLNSSPDFIYISHIHPDHLDANTLMQFAKDVPILIGKYPTPELANIIRRLGFKDVRELPFGEILDFDGAQFSILKEFEGTGDGYVSDATYLMDSSLWVRAPDGSSLLNVNDNPIKIRDVQDILEKYGTPDCVILPYSGASGYPHVFRQYDASEKARRRDELTSRRLNAFTTVARTLGSKWTIPAAGSFVQRGRMASHSEYLHQATPDKIVAHWQEEIGNANGQKLCVMMPGDILDLEKDEITEVTEQPFRRFNHEDRTRYAESLADIPLAHETIVIPDAFGIPMRNLLRKARKNLWEYQQRVQCFPSQRIEVEIAPSKQLRTYENGTIRFAFSLENEELLPFEERAHAQVTRFFVDSAMMLMLLISGANWNNAELSGFVEIERNPDTHNPTIHTLMNYFRL